MYTLMFLDMTCTIIAYLLIWIFLKFEVRVLKGPKLIIMTLSIFFTQTLCTLKLGKWQRWIGEETKLHTTYIYLTGFHLKMIQDSQIGLLHTHNSHQCFPLNKEQMTNTKIVKKREPLISWKKRLVDNIYHFETDEEMAFSV